MKALGVEPATWLVPRDQVEEYKMYGAYEVLGCNTSQVTHQRNYALDHAFEQDKYCLMIDDDLKALKVVTRSAPKGSPISIHDAGSLMLSSMTRPEMPNLAGVGPTNNAFFVQKPVQFHHFIRSGFVAVCPTDLRYDNHLKLKEDYDYTCSHLAKYGQVARHDQLLATFQQRTNRGGCQSYRTPEEEERSVEYLLKKWPEWIKRHATREHEVSLRYS